MDWDEVPEGIGGKVDVNSWHALVQDNVSQTTTELPKEVHSKMPGRLITIWQDKPGGESEIVEFTQNVSSRELSLVLGTDRCPEHHRCSWRADHRPSPYSAHQPLGPLRLR